MRCFRLERYYVAERQVIALNISDTVSMVALVLSVLSGVFSFVTYISTVKHDKKRDTLDAYNRLQNEVFDKLNTFQPREIREIAKNNCSDKYKEISGYIARIEHFCVGACNGIYDKKTVFSLAHGYLDGKQIEERIKPFLDKKDENSEYYKNTVAVINWMKNRSKK